MKCCVIFNEQQQENAEKGFEESQDWKDRIGCSKRDWTFDFSVPFQLPLCQDLHIMNPWPPLNRSDGGKSIHGQPSS